MKSAGQLLLGLFTALGSVLLVVAAASLAILENGQETGFIASFSPTAPRVTMAAGTLAPTATKAGTSTATPIPPTRCPVPQGWTQYIVQSGDTLDVIAKRFNQPSDLIRQKNCLISDTLLPDTTLYLPISVPTNTVPPVLPTLAPTETETPTFTPVSCQPPAGWILYSVKSGEYLFRLAQAFGVSVDQIVAANCLTSLTIYPNQRLYLPNVATRTLAVVPTKKPTSTPVPPTATRILPTKTTVAPTTAVPPTPVTPPVVETTPAVVETTPPVVPTNEKNLPSTSVPSGHR